jgi:uncharacterized membrane protein
VPYGLNDRRQIVGGYVRADGTGQAFVLDRGRYTTVDIPGALASGLSGINDRGQLLGVYLDPGGAPHGYLLDRGVCTTVDVPGALGTQPNSINDHGEIVGISSDAAGVIHGFLRTRGGAYRRIDARGASPSTATLDINDHSQIVGARDLPGAGASLGDQAATMLDLMR